MSKIRTFPLQLVGKLWYVLKDVLVYVVLIILAVVALNVSANSTSGEYLSVLVLRPAIRLLMLGLVLEFTFKRTDFQDEILKGNVAAAVVLAAMAYVVSAL
jgi:hypothetical protein